MNREEFMKQLEELLQKIPASEREDALAYYNDYFDEAGAENEYQVVQELGSPEAVAENILADMQQEATSYVRTDYCSPESSEDEAYKETAQEEQDSKRTQQHYTYTEKSGMGISTKVLIIILLIVTFPLWIGVVAGLFGTVVGLIGAAFGILVSLIGAAVGCVIGGIACIIGGIACLLVNVVEGLVCIGIGALLTAIGLILALLGCFAVGVWLPKLIKLLINVVKKLFHRDEGGNEI